MVRAQGAGGRGQGGFTMIEITVTLAIFGIFLFIIVTLTAEMRRNEKRWPVDFMSHPDVGAVLSRLRRDVYDSKYFPDAWQSYTQSDQTPIIYTITPAGFGETIVWDFTKPGEVTRHAWTANQPQADWVAHATPAFTTEKFDAPNGQTGLHVVAIDDKGKLAIDQILIPRPHG
jgi:prepilin-type N-terminal cleavage/methylation domain-containing protein